MVFELPSALTKYVEVIVGVIDNTTPLPITDPPQLPLYQYQFAPAPSVPPTSPSIEEEPKQTFVGEEVAKLAAVETDAMVTETLTQAVVLHPFSALA